MHKFFNLFEKFSLGETSVEHFGRAFLYSTDIVGEGTVPTLTTG